MQRRPLALVLFFAIAATTAPAQSPAQKSSSLQPAQAAAQRARFARLPLAFEENRGQTGGRVRFLARGAGYTVFLAPDEAVFSLRRSRSAAESPDVLRLQLDGASRHPQITGEEELPGKSNYFFGNDPARWQKDVRTFQRVRYRGIYPGVDLAYYGNGRSLEHDFIVHAGADPGRIELRADGVRRHSLQPDGSLKLSLPSGSVVLEKPRIYQSVADRRVEVEGGYRILAHGGIGFRIAAYDRSHDLVIDPVVVYSTYLGGGKLDTTAGVALDAAGNAYVTGSTGSTDFPINIVAGAYNPTCPSPCTNLHGFISKINPAGTALVYSTYFGGSGTDQALGIAVDAAGNSHVTGITTSTDFPTVNPAQSTIGGNIDAFVIKLNAAGSALVYSTYLGGSGNEDLDNGAFVGGIALDSAGNAYVTGATSSMDFPTLNAEQNIYGGGLDDAFVASYSPTGAKRFATFLGGSDGDAGRAIAVGTNGAYITGSTRSLNFPVTQGAYDTQCGTGPYCDFQNDAFVAKYTFNVNSNVLTRTYATYLGGLGEDVGTGIGVDSAGTAYITGNTTSIDYPTVNPYQAVCLSCSKQLPTIFVSKLNATGTALVYSTFLGGSGFNLAAGIAVDRQGNATITGTTTSPDFPTKNPLPGQSVGGGGVFKITANGLAPSNTGLTSSQVNDLAAAPNGDDYVASGKGVLKSTDGGATWSLVSTGLPPVDALTILPSSATANKLTVGLINAGTYQTTDGGANWSAAGAGLPIGTSVHGLTEDPNNASINYAATNKGVFKSANGGSSWSAINTGLPTSGAFLFYVKVLVDPTNSMTLYTAGRDFVSPPGVYKSTDGGMNWSALNTGLTNLRVNALVLDPNNSTVLYAATDSFPAPGGIFKKSGNNDWMILENTNSGPAVLSLAVDPANSLKIYAGSTGGLWESLDGGANWFYLQFDATVTKVLIPNNLLATTDTPFAPTAGTDAVMAQFAQLPTHIDLGFSSFFGGSNSDQASSCAVSADGDHAWMLVNTNSADFPVTQGAFQTALHLLPSVALGNPYNLNTSDGVDGGVVAINLSTPKMADIAVAKTITPIAAVAVGDKITIRFDVKNNGPDAALFLGTDPLPPGIDINNCDFGKGSPNVVKSIQPPARTLSFNPITSAGFAAGEMGFAEFICPVTQAGMLTNTVTVTVRAPATDPNMGNNSDTAGVTVQRPVPPTVTPNPASFGNVQTTSSGGVVADFFLTITNNDNALNYHPKNFSVAQNTGAAAVAVDNSGCGNGTVPPNMNCSVKLKATCYQPGSFNAFLKFDDNTTAGQQSVPVSVTCTNNPGPTAKVVVKGPVSVVGGQTFMITVEAQDTYGDRTSAYAGTVHFTSSDAGATLPADATLPAGTGTFSFTLNTLGAQTITATDTMNNAITGTSTIIVTGSTPSSLNYQIVLSPAFPQQKPNTVLAFQTLTINITTVPPIVPTGTILVYKDNTTLLKSLQLVNGATAFSTNQLTIGGNNFSLVYTGDNTYMGYALILPLIGRTPAPRPLP